MRGAARVPAGPWRRRGGGTITFLPHAGPLIVAGRPRRRPKLQCLYTAPGRWGAQRAWVAGSSRGPRRRGSSVGRPWVVQGSSAWGSSAGLVRGSSAAATATLQVPRRRAAPPRALRPEPPRARPASERSRRRRGRGDGTTPRPEGRHDAAAGGTTPPPQAELTDGQPSAPGRLGQIVQCFRPDQHYVCGPRQNETEMSRGAAAAATWIFRREESRRRRSRKLNIPRERVAAPRAGYSAGKSRGAAAAAAWIFRREESRCRRGRNVETSLAAPPRPRRG